MLASAAQLGFKPPHPWVSSLWLALDRIMLPPVLQQQVKLQPHQIMDPLQQLHPAVQHTTLTQILTSIADLGLQLRPPPTSKPPAATATKSPTTKASNPPNTSATRPQPKAGTKPQSLTVTQWHTAPASKLPTAATKTQTAAATPQTAAALQTLITAAVSISILPTSASPLPPSTLLPKLWVLSQHLLPTCSPETLASTLAALARLRLQLSGSWMAAWTARSLETMQEASPKQLQSCLVSFAELKLAPARLWADAAMAQILPPQEQQSSCVLQDTDCLCGCSGGEPCSRPTSSRSGSTEMMPSGDVSMGSSRDWSSLSAADWASLLQALASLDVRVELQWLWRVAGLLTPQVRETVVLSGCPEVLYVGLAAWFKCLHDIGGICCISIGVASCVGGCLLLTRTDGFESISRGQAFTLWKCRLDCLEEYAWHCKLYASLAGNVNRSSISCYSHQHNHKL